MPDTPLIDRSILEDSFDNYQSPGIPEDLPNAPHRGVTFPALSLPSSDGQPTPSALSALENSILSIPGGDGKLKGGSISRSLEEVTSSRFNNFVPGDYNNEDAYAQGQSWSNKMVNAVGKGLLLTGTTFLQSTAGMVNGVIQWKNDGRAASFYDNDMNRWIDEVNKAAEDIAPNYYTDVEKNASWYSPDKLLTANFFWNGIVKNMGFAAGAALSGGVFAAGAKALSALPGLSKLFSVGKAAEALAATEQGILAANKVASTFGKVKSLSDKFLGTYNTLSVGGRAVVAGLSTTGEAGFEAYNNLNEFRNKKIEEYKAANNGIEPIGAALDAINAEADNVGNSSFLLNTGLLTATNYIQFPKILGASYKAEKGIINSLTKEIGEITKDAAGNIIQAPSRFGKILSTVNKVRPYTFSVAEGFEEGAQYAIQVGTQDYYNKKYKGNATDFLESLTEGVTQTLGTDEGMENVLIGGLSGALMQGRSTYGERKEKSTNTAAAIAKFNNWKISDFTKETADSINRGTVLQEEREAHLRQGDILESKDSEADYVINYLTPRIKYGRFDLVQSDINDTRQLAMTDEGFAQLQSEGKALDGDTKEQYLQRLTNLESTANSVKSLYQSLNLRYGGLQTKDGKSLYSPEVVDKMIYAATKVADYDKRIPQLNGDLVKAGIDATTIANDIASGNNESYNDAMAKIEGSTQEFNADQILTLKQSLQDVAELTLRRQQFLKEYSDIKNSPEKYTTIEEDELPPVNINAGNTIKITTIDEDDKDIEVGADYYASKEISVKEKNGTISKFTQFKVIGETEAGNIKIQTKDGKFIDISKDAFKKYKLGKVSDTDKKPNAKFFIESSDGIFTYNIGKKGENPVGSIVYDKTTDKLFFESNDGKFRRQVTRDQFSPKKGYTVAQIWSTKKYTPKAEEALKEEVPVDEKMATRNKIIVDLYEGAKEALEKKNKKLEDSKKSLDETITKLKEVQASEKSTPSQNLLAIKRVLSSLTNEKVRLEKEIEELESQKEDLEGTIPYFQELLDNQKDLPEAGSELLQDLKNELAVLNELVENTKDSIKTGKSLLKTVEDALSTALSTLDKFISGLMSSNPKAPLYLEDLQVQLERFYGEEGAKNIIAEREGFTDAVLDLQERIATQTEKLKIPNLQSKTEKLDEQLKELQAGLTALSNELKAKQQILQAFEKYAEQAKKQKQEEEKLIKDKDLFKDLAATLSTDTQNDVRSTPFEQSAHKPDISVVGGTVPIDTGKAHQKRANTFGFKYPSMKNAEDIKGVIVTKNNQDSLIPGLIEHLTVGGGDPETVIALVMVIDNGNGTFTPVDENGERILTKNEAGEDIDLVNSAIYQVFPGDTLTQDYRDGKGRTTMFRESTPENVKTALTEQYVAWRKEKLAQTTLGEPQKFFASFGSPDYVKLSDGKTNDETARTSVDEAGLVSNNTLKLTPVLKVATTNTSVSNGTVTFEGKNNLGKVFLEVPGGLVKLFNNKLTAKKANTVFEVILQLTKNAAAEKNGVKSLKSKTLLNWLSANVYWGIAKDKDNNRIEGGYNNIWFEQVSDENNEAVTKLFISGKDKSFLFTPTSIEANKDDILKLLGNLYHNTNATRVNENKFNDPYYDIISIDEQGNPVVEEWANYQSYLLSSKSADGKTTRNTEDIPLATKFRPLKEEGDVNRKNIYFTLSGTTESYDIPEPEVLITRSEPTTPVVTGDAATQIEALLAKKKTTGLTPSEIATLAQLQKGGVPTAAAPVLAAATITAPKPPSVQVYDLTGEKDNEVEFTFGKASFTINAKLYIESEGKEGFGIKIPGETAQKLINVKKEKGQDWTIETAEAAIAQSLFAKIAPTIEGMKIPVEPAIKDDVVAPEAVIATPTAPVVSDIGKERENELNTRLTPPALKNGFSSEDTREGVIKSINQQAQQGRVVNPEYWIKLANEIFDKYETPSVSDIEAKKADIERRRQEFPEAQSNTRTPITQKLLDYFAEVKKIPKFAEDLTKGTYINWLRNNEELGYKVAELLNAPKKAFDLIAKYETELAAFNTTTPVVSDKKADIEKLKQTPEGKKIEKERKSDLKHNSDVPETSYIAGTNSPKDALIKFRTYLTDVLGWEKMPIAFANNKLTLDYLGKTLSIDAKIIQLAKSNTFIEIDVKDVINAKYDAELAALEDGEKPAEVKGSAFRDRQRGNGDEPEFRMALREDINRFEGENWKKLEEWIKANFPNVPIYRVKNAIKATGNKKAWGLLKDGAIYVYENAQVGTIYHEVFEAVWKSFSTFKERQAIMSEFKNRQGSYFDVFSERNIKYSEATAGEIKEQLAEEFRDFVQEKKLPPRPVSGKSWIAAMFSDLVNAIKNLFLGAQGANNTERLFNKIGSGGFSKYNPYENQLSYAKKGIIDIEDVIAGPNDEFRLEIDVPQEQVHEIMQQMTYITLEKLSRTNKSLFGIQKQSRKQLYASLKDNVLRTIGNEGDAIEQDLVDKKITPEAATSRLNNIETLYNNVEKNWAEVAKKHEEYLQAYSIKFDDNDNVILTDEDNSGKADYLDARRIDSFRKAHSAIRLLLATLPITRKNAAGETKIVRNSIGGVTLLPVDKVHITLLNKLHDSRNIEEMLERLKDIAKGDSNYEALFLRLTKSTVREGVDLSKIDNTHDWQLLTSFYKAFKKQNADNQIVFILSNGTVVIGDGSLSSAARQSKNDMFNDLISKLKSGSPYVTYSAKKYNVNNNLGKVALSAKAGDIKTYTSFLENIGISFTPKELSKLSDNQVKTFRVATEGIRESMLKYKDLASLNKQTLDVDGQLLKLGTIRAILDNPEFKSTYFNVNGERSQTYIGTNTLSNFYDFISKVDNINKLEGTEYKYLLTDVFTGANTNGSVILNAMFDIAGNGDRISGTEDLFKTGYVDGTVNETNNKKKESSKLNPKERLVQEINLNLEGQYLNLVPGDASIEWMVKMVNSISVDTLVNTGDSKVFETFKNYFMSEVALSRDGRDIVEIKLTDKEKKEGKEQRKSTDLRFFKGILGKDLHDEIVSYATDLAKSPEDVYLDYEKEINKAVKDFIDKETKETRETLEQYGIISLGENGIEVENLAFSKEENISEEDLNINLKALSINYIIANIEFHKLIYSDPYQYKDELKRVKSFNSPGQSIIANSKKANASINAVYNKGYKPGDVGYTDMTADHFNSTTSEDVNGWSDLEDYGSFEETDGGGYITMKANRVFRIRAGNWNDNEDLQYRYDVAYYKTIKGTGLSQQEKEEQGLVLSKEEQKLYLGKNPEVRSAYTPIKPIVAGNKDDGENFNDVALHKFALVPLSFRILHQMNPESNAIKFIEKMESEGIDYTVFASGAKVGGGIATPLYTEKGDFNTEPFREVNRIPFSIMRVQAEVPSKEAAYVTQGSQITKLATMDFLEAGVPIDFDPSIKDINDRFVAWMKLDEKDKMRSEIYKEIKNNQRILEAKIEQGYSTLLKKLSIEKTKDGFVIKNIEKLTKTLSDEILKREVNENILDAFAGFKKGEVVLEATPAYQQIRNILYSIADKNVVRPKITGGQKVQIPSTLFEGTKNEAKKIIRKDGKETLAYESTDLEFYVDKDGKRVCEIMIGRWFKSDMTDNDLLEYLNTTEEGKKILSGIAFRIPTQKQNSIDVFRIKKFLPTEFGDSVVIPSALVKKVGSDFDIDKLSIYLKNLYKSGDGKLKMVPFFGFGEEAKKKIADFLLKEDLESIFDIEDVTEFDEEEGEQKEEESYEDVADRMYAQSLENEYIQSLQNLISHPLNFKNLTKPNSAKELQDLADEIVELTGEKEFDYSSTTSMLSRTFMSSLRQAFVSGKQGVGIAAVAQTNNAQAQRAVTYIDDTRLAEGDERISDLDKKILGDGEIKFEKYNSIFVNGKKRPTISIAINQAGNYISDIIGQFIDGFVDIAKGPWIMQLGAKPNVANTWLFLSRIGVPIKTVAYFMNQPIIKEYLSSIENAGYSWLFIDKFVDQAKESYSEGNDIVVTDIPSETLLRGTLGGKKLTPQQQAEQRFMLDEFLKYAKMAEHLFQVQQGSNFDTAVINDSSLVFKKKMQLAKARNTIFAGLNDKREQIDGVDAIINNSFIKVLRDTIYDIRDAFADTVLISDRKSVRQVIEAVTTPYIDLNDRDFVKLSQKAVSDLFDWAVQTDRKINTNIKAILLGTPGVMSAAEEIMALVQRVKKDPNPNNPLRNNLILNSIKRISGDRENVPDNLELMGNYNKVYDQNQIIDAFLQLKKELVGDDKAIYGKLVRLAVLQSGLTNSPISFTSLIPYEDFKEIYNQTLSVLEKMPNLNDFYTLDVFQRNNWSDPNIVPFKKAEFIQSKKDKRWYYNMDMKGVAGSLKTATVEGVIPQMLNISPMSREGASDFLVYTYEKQLSKNKEENKRLKAEAKKKGDTSYIVKYLFKKVYNSFGEPLIQTTESKDGAIYEKYVYKAINAWGASFKANEFYGKLEPGDPLSTTGPASVIDNGFVKLEARIEQIRSTISDNVFEEKYSGEVEDNIIETTLNNGAVPITKKVVPLVEAEIIMPTIDSSKKINIYASTGENAELSNFANRPVSNALGVDFKNVEAAFQYAKINWSTGDNSDIAMKLQTASGAEARALGKKITGLNTKAWDENSSTIMKSIIKDSFIENPSALKTLLATGNAELTHTQDNTKWGKEFPKLLMEVRNELRPTQAVSGFQGYKGEFVNTGKGTPQGDGKDKAMRKVANSAIVELASNKDSSSKTSLGELGLPKEGDKIIMLARNGSLSGKALRAETKEQIRQANLDNAEFVVGDMPEVDNQFIDYLQEIGAKFTVYHTGSKPRIQITSKPTQAVSGDVKSQIEVLEAKKKSKGLSPSEMATLTQLQILNVLNKKEQDSKNCNG